jgi:tetratricopeptide (TPR) repeat protein
MRFKAATILVLAVLGSSSFAQEAEGEPKENPALEAEIEYVEALVNNGYPDIAAPVIEETKKKWPESEARFFAIEVRGMLALGKFDEAEKRISALPDRKSTKYWAARLEVANNYFGRRMIPECMKIYDEFFKLYPKAPKDIRKFYMQASYSFGQLLVGDNQYAKAAKVYEGLLAQLKDAEWCDIAVETTEIYLRIAETESDKKKREAALKSATKIVDKLLWQLGRPVIFGRAVAMKAHIEELRGNVDRAAEIIEEYLPNLEDIHNQIVAADPNGRDGLLRMSPLPECRYLQAKMRWDEALRESKAKKRDDEKIKSLMFGPRKKTGKRDGSKGAYNICMNIFLRYETSAWAAAAGELAEQIKAFAEKEYNAKIKTKITPEQIAKVRAAQFKGPNDLFLAGDYLKAIDGYYKVLSIYPEVKESVRAVENIASAYLDLVVETKDNAKKAEYRDYADAVEGYLAERFSGHNDRLIMIAAGDATVRLAAKEQERKEIQRADWLYSQFFRNYREHPNAAALAAARANEYQKAGDFVQATNFWSVIADDYTNSTYYAGALAQLSRCCGELGDKSGELDYMSRYVNVETVRLRRLQAKFNLAQMYQRDGVAILASAASNSVPDEVAMAEKRGSMQILRAIKQFREFSVEAEKAISDPATTAEDKAKYEFIREAALYLVGDCWVRINRPETKLNQFRENAVKEFEVYLKNYPAGKYAKAVYERIGSIYTVLGQMEKTKDALDRLSRQFPDSDEAKNAKPRLAKSLIEMGMAKEGAEIYAEMLRTDGAYNANHFLDAADALVEAKNWDLAKRAYQRVLQLAKANQFNTIARARLGMARMSLEQGSLAEARDALDQFLGDPKLSKMTLAADANFLLVKVASEQGRKERDSVMRGKYFNAAIGALKKVRQYWSKRPVWEQDRLDLESGEVLIDRMRAEMAMDLKTEAMETCARAASTFQVFIQAHGVSEAYPIEKMNAEQLANLERAYVNAIRLFSEMGAQQADRVKKFGEEYKTYFPKGKAMAEIERLIKKAENDLPSK